MGLTRQAVTHIIGNKANYLPENPIKSTSAAEELEDGRNIRDVDDVSHTEVAKMAAVHHTFIMKIRVDMADELLGKCDYHTSPTIPPKSKGMSGDEAEKLKKGLSSP